MENKYVNIVRNNMESKTISAFSNVLNYGINFIKAKTLISYTTNSLTRYYQDSIRFLFKASKKSKKYIRKDNGGYVVDTIFALNTNHECIIIVKGGKRLNNIDFENGNEIYDLELLFIGKNARKIFNNKFLPFIGITKSTNYIDKKNSYINYDIVAKNETDWYSYRSNEKVRKFDSYFLDNDVQEEITIFINNWLNKKEIFNRKGLKYKTGLLVYGKPGTGKSTLVKVLASEFGFTLVNIDTTTFDNLNVTELTQAINNEPGKVIVFIDEIDVLFKSRNDDLTDEQAKRTTKLLSFLDGATSPDNVLFVASTNYKDRLDEAILRKGRFDKIIELKNINRESAIKMCKSFDLTQEETDKILSKYKEENINPSELQNDIIQMYKNEN